MTLFEEAAFIIGVELAACSSISKHVHGNEAHDTVRTRGRMPANILDEERTLEQLINWVSD